MEQQDPGSTGADAGSLNQALVDDLVKQKVIRSPEVEAAFRTVLRHHFLPGTPLETVYSDRAISTKQNQEGQWLSSSSQPTMMAIMLEQLGLEPGQSVLEIGAGTGYNAALMAHIVGEEGRVVTIDIDDDLVEAARQQLSQAGFERVQAVCADGGYGYPDLAPFDRIILTVGAPDVTPAWWEQLKPDGRLVLPLLLKGSMKCVAFEQRGDHLESLSVQDCGFIQLRGDFAETGVSQVPLGPDPDLYLETLDPSIDAEAAYAYLNGASRDWATGVEVLLWEALIGNLWTWLALHEPRLCKLFARNEKVEWEGFPALVAIDAKQKSKATGVLVDKTGLVALNRPPDQPARLLPMEKIIGPETPSFPLYLRQFGPEAALAEGLLKQIQEWDAAGRPSFEGMHIRAYRKGADYAPAEGEILLGKQWTTLVVEWA